MENVGMSNITFVRPTHHYESYHDFWRLVELSGFPTIYENELDITKPGTYIVTPMNGNFIEHMTGSVEHWHNTGNAIGGQIVYQKNSGLHRRAHIIIWNLERPGGSGSVWSYGDECFRWMSTRIADEVWVSDPVLADETQTRYVVLGSHPGLGELSDDKEFDFCHMSAVNSRRVHIYKNFPEHTIGQNCWPPERDEVLKKSRFALNVHQDNWPFCEPLRIALFAAYGLPVISESLVGNQPYRGIATASYPDALVTKLKSAIRDDYKHWKAEGLALHHRLCHELPFGPLVVQAVNETVGLGWRW
jgi:hypothetical protein